METPAPSEPLAVDAAVLPDLSEAQWWRRSHLCSRLSKRGLPEWLLACLQKGLPEHCLADAVTDEKLAGIGIPNPLHRRRVLREIEEMRADQRRAEETRADETLLRLGVHHPLHRRRVLREVQQLATQNSERQAAVDIASMPRREHKVDEILIRMGMRDARQRGRILREVQPVAPELEPHQGTVADGCEFATNDLPGGQMGSDGVACVGMHDLGMHDPGVSALAEAAQQEGDADLIPETDMVERKSTIGLVREMQNARKSIKLLRAGVSEKGDNDQACDMESQGSMGFLGSDDEFDCDMMAPQSATTTRPITLASLPCAIVADESGHLSRNLMDSVIADDSEFFAVHEPPSVLDDASRASLHSYGSSVALPPPALADDFNASRGSLSSHNSSCMIPPPTPVYSDASTPSQESGEGEGEVRNTSLHGSSDGDDEKRRSSAASELEGGMLMTKRAGKSRRSTVVKEKPKEKRSSTGQKYSIIRRNLANTQRFIPLIGDPLAQWSVPQNPRTSTFFEPTQEDPCLDWEDWLQTRLRPGGAFSLVLTVQQAGINGNLDMLRDAMKAVCRQSSALVESLEKTPVPPEAQASWKSGPMPATFWGWALARKRELEQADEQLMSVLTEARDTIDRARLGNTAKQRRGAHSSGGRRKQVLADTILEGQNEPLHDSDGTGSGAMGGRRLAVFRKFAKNARNKDIKQQATLAATMQNVSLICTQNRLKEGVKMVESKLVELDAQIDLVSGTRHRAEVVLQELQVEQRDVFNKYAEAEAHWIRDIEATTGALREFEAPGMQLDLTCKDVFVKRLEELLTHVKYMVGASSLVGQPALRVADEAGLSRPADGDLPMENPWGNLADMRPPWASSYHQAVIMWVDQTGQTSRLRRQMRQTLSGDKSPSFKRMASDLRTGRSGGW